MAEKVILDCDNTMGLLFKEVDDGLTILHLLGLSEIDLLGITTTFGNGKIEQVFNQTQRLIKHLQIDLPVLMGAGFNGQEPNTPAAQYLVDMVNQHPQQVTLLATGPVGNLFAAAQIDPRFFLKVKGIVAMGGYLQPVKLGYRNLQEMNFSANPIAAQEMLGAPCPVTVFPAQACLDAPYRMKDIRRADYWPKWIKRALVQWLITFSSYTGGRVFYLWDLLPAVYLTKPDLFDIRSFHLGSSLDDFAVGNLVKGDHNSPMINICSRIINHQAFFTHLENTWRKTYSIYLS